MEVFTPETLKRELLDIKAVFDGKAAGQPAEIFTVLLGLLANGEAFEYLQGVDLRRNIQELQDFFSKDAHTEFDPQSSDPIIQKARIVIDAALQELSSSTK